MAGEASYSVIVPVYRNAESLPELIGSLGAVGRVVRERFGLGLEVVMVVDASPDDSCAALERLLPAAPFRSRLVVHARNFGAFAAIRTGLKAGAGPFFGVIAADLQEPPELLIDFLAALDGGSDVVVGRRLERDDPLPSRALSGTFWRLYRALVMPELPPGGVDLFGCTARVRDQLVALEEANSSLIGQLFWLGFERKEVPYARSARKHGRSAWSIAKRLGYLADSVFAFTDLPIRLLTGLGMLGLAISVPFGLAVIAARLAGTIEVPGYAATILTIMFFGALNLTGIGIVGGYVWRAYENTKRRPLAIVGRLESFAGTEPSAATGRPVGRSA
jgi:glycosyltransferase involved in cell wall biosynthesis